MIQSSSIDLNLALQREEIAALKASLQQAHELLRDTEATRAFFQASQETLYRFFMQAPLPMVLLEVPGYIFRLANLPYETLMGRQVVGKSVREAFPAGEAEAFIPLVDEVFQTGAPCVGKELPFELADSDGIIRSLWIDVGYHPFRNADGQIQGIFALLNDVTDQVLAKKRTLENQKQLQLALQAGQVGTWQVDLGTQTLVGSPEHSAILGIPPAPHNVFQLARERVHPEDRESVNQAWVDASRKRGPFQIEYRIVRPGGETRWVEVRGQTKNESPTHPGSFMGVMADITERKLREERLRAIAELAPQFVWLTDQNGHLTYCNSPHPRTIGRTEEELQETIRQLIQQKNLRERFVDTLSHDLRTPLACAKVTALLLVRKADHPDDIRRLASQLVTNIDRADQMIRDLLDANRIRAGESLALQLEENDLKAIAIEVIEELRALHGDRFVLRADLPVHGFWSKADLRRVIENLATNAIKHGEPQRPVTLTLSASGETARLDVHNEGHAIPPEDQAQLFEPFKRLESAQAGDKKGWGLGLTLVKGIVEAHGGTVTVQSQEKLGTTFSLTLPLDPRNCGPA